MSTWVRGEPPSMPRGYSSELVADPAQQLVAVGDVLVGLDAERHLAVDDADDAAAELGLRDQDLEPVRRGAEDPADLRHQLQLVEHVDREALADEDDEDVPGRDRERVRDRQLDELLVVARVADEPGPGRLAEGEPA